MHCADLMPIKVIVVLLVLAVPAMVADAQDWRDRDGLRFRAVDMDPASVGAQTRAGRAGDTAQPAAGDGEAAGAQDADAVLLRIRTVLESIEAEQSLNGENSPGLVPLLTELADTYYGTGDYADAMVVLERAQLNVRRSAGLYSLEQAPVIERMIEIQMAVAPIELATELETELRDLVRRNPGDPRNVDIMTEMAARQVQVANYLLLNGLPPEFSFNISIYTGFGPTAPRFGPTRTARSVASSMLRQARSSYGLAMNEIINQGSEDIPQLLELEDTIIDSFYFELTDPRFHRCGQRYGASGRLQFGGRNALRAKLANSRLFPGTPEAVTAAMLELADWDLMFMAFGRAMDRYESALDYLRSQGADDEQLAAVFSPAAPISLPAFASESSIDGSLADVRGHFDLEIEINRFGRVRDLRVIDQSPNASSTIKRRLKRFVYQTRFRPRYIDGEWQRSDRFRVRYEFGYAAT